MRREGRKYSVAIPWPQDTKGKVSPHQSLLSRHWRASINPSSGFEKGLNSLKARSSISSSSSSHSGDPNVSTAGNELAAFTENKGDTGAFTKRTRGLAHSMEPTLLGIEEKGLVRAEKPAPGLCCLRCHRGHLTLPFVDFSCLCQPDYYYKQTDL